MIRSIQPSGCGWICALDDHDDEDDHGDDNDDDDDDGDDDNDDIYVMMKCVSVCLSRKMIIVCLFVMFYGFAR